MEEQLQEDIGSVSGLSSLENDAEDDFERLMVQNARDERRLNEALHGRVQAFRKARTHPRVGLTMDNLERNNARNDVNASNARVKFDSPPSSSGSIRSDPAIHAPPGWGRKSRTNRNWMRTITHEEEQQQTPLPADDQGLEPYGDNAHESNVPRCSVEDSPLSHKSSIHGTPRNDRSAEWDLTFELNEASIIASTPYVPRNTALDDIRQREIESLREQRVATARLDRIREGSPEQTRRPRTSSAQTENDTALPTTITEYPAHDATSPQKRLRTRTNSWQSIGKSQAVTGKENTPVAMYKSVESIATVDRADSAHASPQPLKRIPHRREDSQDLLRRLARVSNTPSPGRVAARPQSAPAQQPATPLQSTRSQPPPMVLETSTGDKEEPIIPENFLEPLDLAPQSQTQPDQQEPPAVTSSAPDPAPDPVTEDVDATPMPVEQSVLNPKTPVVTGAWVDTPGPRTARSVLNPQRVPSRSPRKRSPQKLRSPEKQEIQIGEAPPRAATLESIRPRVPSSALEALVQEAKASGHRRSDDYGDSTINSLEEMITTTTNLAGAEEEDTLQGLELPTGVPRTEAERQRQQEILHLHRMNDRLRAARTGIRDASRGMKRVEDQVEHVGGEAQGSSTALEARDCPCAVAGEHQFSLWRWSRSFFWQERLKTLRQASNSHWKLLGGLTGLGLFLLTVFTWWVSEEIAWYVQPAAMKDYANAVDSELYCHPLYAQSSRHPFSVNMDAPEFPFVLPTLIYRNFIRVWWLPVSSFLSWIVTAVWRIIFGFDDESAHMVNHSIRSGIQSTATSTGHWVVNSHSQVAEDLGWDLSMMNDERI